jgi:hypothetical protein
MTSTDRDDLMLTQEKLEWITPKISLMAAGDTNSNVKAEYDYESKTSGGLPVPGVGPS